MTLVRAVGDDTRHLFVWTDASEQVLRQSWAAGGSASKIAKEIGGGVTRNGVIAKVHRLGISKRSKGAPASGGKTRTTWSDAKIAEFHRLYHEGLGDGAIAAALGAPFTRKMVQGKRKNLGLPSHFASPATRKAARPPKPRKEPTCTSIGFYSFPRTVEPADAKPIRVTIADLTPSSCRWPLGDPSDLDAFRYCGAQTTNQRRATADMLSDGASPYCPGHHRLAYNGARG